MTRWSIACGLVWTAIARAQIYTPPEPTRISSRSPFLAKVGIDQKPGAQIPLDLPFTNEAGEDVRIGQYFGKPVILAMVYYQCPSLCDMVLNGVVRGVKSLNLTAGGDFDVVAVSFDPRETPEMAAAKKRSYLKEYNRDGAERGWHFLTGSEKSSKTLAEEAGFHYAYDTMTNQYAHPSAILILTPQGRVNRYFYGIDYPSRDLKLALVEASKGQIGSVVDQVLLFCYHYDPATGKYGLVIMNVLRVLGLATFGALATFMIVMLRRDFRHPASRGGA